MAVIIKNMDMPKSCGNCTFSQWYAFTNDSHVRCMLVEGFACPSDKNEICPLKSVDRLVDTIEKSITEMKEKGRQHESQVRQNGELVARGLELAVKIIKEYCEVE